MHQLNPQPRKQLPVLRQVIAPVHGGIGIPLHQQRGAYSQVLQWQLSQPAAQGADPAHVDAMGLQRVLADKGEKIPVGRVFGEAPRYRVDQTVRQDVGDARLPPASGVQKGCKQYGAAEGPG